MPPSTERSSRSSTTRKPKGFSAPAACTLASSEQRSAASRRTSIRRRSDSPERHATGANPPAAAVASDGSVASEASLGSVHRKPPPRGFEKSSARSRRSPSIAMIRPPSGPGLCCTSAVSRGSIPAPPAPSSTPAKARSPSVATPPSAFARGSIETSIVAIVPVALVGSMARSRRCAVRTAPVVFAHSIASPRRRQSCSRFGCQCGPSHTTPSATASLPASIAARCSSRSTTSGCSAATSLDSARSVSRSNSSSPIARP